MNEEGGESHWTDSARMILNGTIEAVLHTEKDTRKEVAEYLKLTEKTAYRLAAEGKAPSFKVGGSWRFRRGEIESWIDRQLNNQK